MATESSVAVLPDTGNGTAAIANLVTTDINGDTVYLQRIVDAFDIMEVAPDQAAGADGVLTFTPSSRAYSFGVQASGGDVRVTTDDQTPSASTGVPVLAGGWHWFPVSAAEVRVWAPSGASVTVWFYRH